jgi:hypothetical protein
LAGWIGWGDGQFRGIDSRILGVDEPVAIIIDAVADFERRYFGGAIAPFPILLTDPIAGAGAEKIFVFTRS